jgi:cysteinyl-tRNA synthetase
MHNGFLDMRGEKMSKSLGNVVRVPEALAIAPGEAIRMHLLGTHYRQPADFSSEGVFDAKHSLDRFYGALARVPVFGRGEPDSRVVAALADDINTPNAFAVLHELVGDLNRQGDVEIAMRLRASGSLLGLFNADAKDWLENQGTQRTIVFGQQEHHIVDHAGNRRRIWPGMSPEEIQYVIEQRLNARRTKDYKQADFLRVILGSVGVILEDRPDGTTDWRRA